jgi:hypothetical protein
MTNRGPGPYVIDTCKLVPKHYGMKQTAANLFFFLLLMQLRSSNIISVIWHVCGFDIP